MNSSFFPTPSKQSDSPRMNLTTVLNNDHQLPQESGAPVPISLEKKSSSYFKRMGSPAYSLKKDGKVNSDTQRVRFLIAF